MIHSQDWLAMRTERSPHHLAIIEGRRKWTYRELNHLAARLAASLAGYGVEPGQRLGVLLPNRIEYVGLIFAALRLGAVLAPLNHRLRPNDLSEYIGDLSCSWVISDPTSGTSSEMTWLDAIPAGKLDIGELTKPLKPSRSYESYLTGEIDYRNTCLIMSTSGSTGSPLGVKLSCDNLFWSAYGSASRLGNHEDDRWLACLPLFHVGGIGIVIRGILNRSAVVLHEGFQVEQIVRDLFDLRINLLSVVPTMLQRLLGEITSPLGKNFLRHLLVGGGHLPNRVLERAVEHELPVRLTYGMTETASQVSTATSRELLTKPGSVGKPLDFTQVRIFRENGQMAEANEQGEIIVEGPTVMQGYVGRNKRHGKSLRKGELKTGDLGYLDEDECLWVTGRLDEMIKTAGEKVYPVEVEEALLNHPNIQEVKVIGTEDEEMGEKVVAAVVISENRSIDPDEINNFLRRQISAYKLPGRILFLKELPRTGSGKIDTRMLKRYLEDYHECSNDRNT